MGDWRYNFSLWVSRVVTDMLMYQPDFVVVDFSVNDEPEKFFQETYEGLVRRMLTWSSVPAVFCF